MNRSRIEELKEAVDLVSLVEKDLGPGKRSGRWTRYHCPFHDDQNPSLGVTNGDNGRPPYWKCFAGSCGTHGDALSWLMEYRGMEFLEAVEALGGDPNDTQYKPPPRSVRLPTAQQPPSEDWQVIAWKIVKSTRDLLWAQPGEKAREWLKDRGITEESMHAWWFGYSEGKEYHGVWVPRGIVIPCWSAGKHWYLKVRTPVGSPKYKKIKGSKSGLFGIDTTYFRDTVFIVEGELDAVLFYQTVHEYAGVITPGSATDRLDPARWGGYLHTVKNLIAVYDKDEAGQKGFENLSRLSRRITRANLPEIDGVTDITDFHLEGGDLNRWAKFKMEAAV